MKTIMHFVDYDINLLENGDIELDESLTLDQLGLEESQLVRVRIINNKVVFRKIDWAELTLLQS